MPDVKLVLTILAVSDLARAVKFYRDAFGFGIHVDVPVYVELEVSDRHHLGLYQREAWARVTTRAPLVPAEDEVIGNELYFLVDDVQEASSRIERAGGTLLSSAAMRPWGDLAAYYRDPDGNVLVVATPPIET
ncbi:MAG: VOC family protein [Planctomycetes bacterium]|nr:VOC family protein [Planctomycetota bacterium]